MNSETDELLSSIRFQVISSQWKAVTTRTSTANRSPTFHRETRRANWTTCMAWSQRTLAVCSTQTLWIFYPVSFAFSFLIKLWYYQIGSKTFVQFKLCVEIIRIRFKFSSSFVRFKTLNDSERFGTIRNNPNFGYLTCKWRVIRAIQIDLLNFISKNLKTFSISIYSEFHLNSL